MASPAPSLPGAEAALRGKTRAPWPRPRSQTRVNGVCFGSEALGGTAGAVCSACNAFPMSRLEDPGVVGSMILLDESNAKSILERPVLPGANSPFPISIPKLFPSMDTAEVVLKSRLTAPAPPEAITLAGDEQVPPSLCPFRFDSSWRGAQDGGEWICLWGAAGRRKASPVAPTKPFRPFATAPQELPEAKSTWRCCWAGLHLGHVAAPRNGCDSLQN